jgi:hypothetical protein
VLQGTGQATQAAKVILPAFDGPVYPAYALADGPQAQLSYFLIKPYLIYLGPFLPYGQRYM